MSKITSDRLTRSGIAGMYPCGNSGRQRVKVDRINNNNNTLIYIAPACRMTSEAQIVGLSLQRKRATELEVYTTFRVNWKMFQLKLSPQLRTPYVIRSCVRHGKWLTISGNLRWSRGTDGSCRSIIVSFSISSSTSAHCKQTARRRGDTERRYKTE